MLLSIYKADQAWGGCSCHGPDDRSGSRYELEEVVSFDEAVERCFEIAVADEHYSTRSSIPNDDYAFFFMRTATAPELAGSDAVESYKDIPTTGDLRGGIVQFDLTYRIASLVRQAREECARRKRALAEAAELRKQQLEAERQARKVVEDRAARFATFQTLKKEFEGGALRRIPIETVGANRLRVLLRDANIDPAVLDDAAVFSVYRARFGNFCVVNSSLEEDISRNGGAA